MVNSISFDWSENYDENTGESKFNLDCPNTDHHEKYGYRWETAYEATIDTNGDECEPYEGCPTCEDDSGNLDPMMNYLYPLDYKGFVDEGFDEESRIRNQKTRVKIASETNCICVEDNKTGEWFLTLTGGGMDLSPSIGYAFYLAQKWLPADFLINDLKAGWCKDSLSSENFEELKKVVVEQLGMEKSKIEEQMKQWNMPTKEITQ